MERGELIASTVDLDAIPKNIVTSDSMKYHALPLPPKLATVDTLSLSLEFKEHDAEQCK